MHCLYVVKPMNILLVSLWFLFKAKISLAGVCNAVLKNPFVVRNAQGFLTRGVPLTEDTIEFIVPVWKVLEYSSSAFSNAA